MSAPANNSVPSEEGVKGPPQESYGKLFLRFLRFGSLAWGGPVAQIDMIRQELVTEGRWVSNAAFKRVLAIYQALPGPEAHELCVYFGMLARGHLGGVLAGLGFMLPGFILMFLLSWLYLSYKITETPLQAVFLGIQPAVIALILRASHRIGSHVLTDRPLLIIAAGAMVADLLALPFWITLPSAGIAYLFATQKRKLAAIALGIACLVAAAVLIPETSPLKTAWKQNQAKRDRVAAIQVETAPPRAEATDTQLFISGLRGGLLTFGGAYTAIPFIQRDAVQKGEWMSNEQFLDGVAMSGILPAPLIIFSTFVGYVGGGPLGAVLMTLGIFLPAFSFSLLFHTQLERLMSQGSAREFLEGITAGVVGIIVSTLITLAIGTLTEVRAMAIFALALLPLYLWKSKAVIPAVIFISGTIGWFIYRS